MLQWQSFVNPQVQPRGSESKLLADEDWENCPTAVRIPPASGSEEVPSGAACNPANASRLLGKPFGNAAVPRTTVVPRVRTAENSLMDELVGMKNGMLSWLTFFAARRGWRVRLFLSLLFTITLDVNGLCLAKFSTMGTLCDGPSLLLYFKERAIGMFARRRPVAFNTGLAVEMIPVSATSEPRWY